MDINELARQCHQVAVEKGFYNFNLWAPSETEIHLWKQITHLFIELTEAERIVTRKPEARGKYSEEIADVGIVLLDMSSWLGLDLELPRDIPMHRGQPLSSARLAAGKLADSVRKKGIVTEELSVYASILLAYLIYTCPTPLDIAIMQKLETNKTRPYRYGVGTAEPLEIPK